MAWSPRLMRQSSCACSGIDIGSWCSSRQRATGFSRRFVESDHDDEFYEEDYYPMVRQSSRWRGLWRRIVREKRRIMNHSAAPPAHVPYDAYSYAQNFDDGSAWVEPENLSRSFSARYADPSRMSRRMP